MNKRDTVYYARIFPNVGMYELDELKIRTVTNEYFVGIEKRSKQAFLFQYSDIGKTIFTNRQDALNKVKEAEKNKNKTVTETYYEEY